MVFADLGKVPLHDYPCQRACRPKEAMLHEGLRGLQFGVE